ncbi:serine/threonine-protein phosphatase 2A 56 kDa regulatory subunit delta isoform-like [Thalassophryne amazonica]|uniref:serine/threonine-protein phosphatase 2A 56 kDa regulatory subunit delta isoform-like n=1 Tax=Thalassophryne amazonica TaxID=390379 RepID=UPI001471F1FC|nr:serine/threonine-protein phosphatase 2A 56 kDa regulatory subunit delta isoform-like [Thalassophryne amazonica]
MIKKIHFICIHIEETPPAVQATRHKKQVDDKIKEKKDDIWIHPPSSKLSSPHQSDVETSSPALSNKDVAESGCQEEPDIQESEQIKKNIEEQQKICPPTREEEIIIELLEQCSEVYDFYGDPETYFLDCQMKEMMLNQLSSYITHKRTIISECLYPEIVSMVSTAEDYKFTGCSMELLLLCRSYSKTEDDLKIN